MDDLLVAGFAILFPILTTASYPRVRSLLRADPAARIRVYRQAMAWQWGLALCAVIVWFFEGRSAGELGLDAPGGGRFWLGLGLALVVVAWLAVQLHRARTDEKARQVVLRRLEPVKELLPRSREEMRLFAALSITAGICEEIVYRGFLIWYLAQFMPPVFAAFLSGIVFGLAHLYQGVHGFFRAGTLGLILAGLFLLTGSLWISIVLHATVDVLAGILGRALLGPGSRTPGAEPSLHPDGGQ